jgi:hypothetical protein
MISREVLLKNAVKRFLEYGESTMNAALNANVGLELLRLREIYLKDEDQENEIAKEAAIKENEKILNKAFAEIAQEVAKRNKEKLNDAWKFIQERITQPTNELDIIEFIKDGKPVKRCIELKTVLGLAYLALTDGACQGK